MRRLALVAAGAVLAAGGAVLAASMLLRGSDGAATRDTGAAAAEPLPSERFAVTHADEPVPAAVADDAAYVLGDRLQPQGPHEPVRLSRRLQAPNLGQGAAVAVPSRDGRHLAYHAWDDGTPLLLVLDLRSGEERMLARGAQAVAWSASGQIAYFQAEQERQGPEPYLGHVVVRETVDAPPRRWTPSAGAFEVRAWAGTRLLVAVRPCPTCPDTARGPDVGLYSLGGPGELQPLPLADLSALSPDGRWAVGPYQETPGPDGPTPLARLVELETGRVADTLDVPEALRAAGLPVGAGGFFEASWRGDEIVAHTFAAEEGMLVFFRVEEERLVLDDALRLERGAFGVRFGPALGRPTFSGAGTSRVVVSAAWEREAGGYRVAVLSCDRTERMCTAGTPRDGSEWFALVESPSRP